MRQSPVIIVGMHRSGTTLLVKCLDELGLFWGAKKENNLEAIFFSKLNSWLFRMTNASWDNPSNFLYMNAQLREHALRVIDLNFSSLIRRSEFLGWSRSFRYRDIRTRKLPMGWKDPRNTFTFQVWDVFFPDAKVIHIYRNPLDVARSLQQREIKMQTQSREFRLKNYCKELFVKGTIRYQYSARVENLNEGIKLWEEYVTEALSLQVSLADRMLSIRYEDFLENPEDILRRILGFLGMTARRELILRVVKAVNPTRSYAFLKDEELLPIYRSMKDWKLMKQLGYQNLQVQPISESVTTEQQTRNDAV